jgi:hypothetical protein
VLANFERRSAATIAAMARRRQNVTAVRILRRLKAKQRLEDQTKEMDLYMPRLGHNAREAQRNLNRVPETFLRR